MQSDWHTVIYVDHACIIVFKCHACTHNAIVLLPKGPDGKGGGWGPPSFLPMAVAQLVVDLPLMKALDWAETFGNIVTIDICPSIYLASEVLNPQSCLHLATQRFSKCITHLLQSRYNQTCVLSNLQVMRRRTVLSTMAIAFATTTVL